ncbi:MAG: 4-vinyl reductase [Anaerolineae bacterium]
MVSRTRSYVGWRPLDMEAPESVEYALPNKMGRVILLALEEELGLNGLNAVLKLARLSHLSDHYPPANFEVGMAFSDVARLLGAIDEMYGPRAGRMLQLRTGRICFRQGVQDFGALLGFADLAFRILPLRWRVRFGLEVLAEILNRYSDHEIELAAEDGGYLWITHRCGICWDRKTSYPACALMVGLLQETLYWVSGGRLFDVEEIACVATGDPTCTLRVDESPLV